MALAAADTIAVTTSFIGSRWIETVVSPQYHFVRKSRIFCKTVPYLTHVLKFVTSWMLAAAAADRFICITNSLNKKFHLTSKRVVTVIAIIVIAGFLENAAMLKHMDSGNSQASCVAAEEEQQLQEILTWMVIILTQICPLVIISVLNIALLRFLANWHRERSRQFFNGESGCTSQIAATVDLKTVLQLVVVSIFFVALHVPYTVVALIIKNFGELDVCDFFYIFSLYEITNITFQMNHCINFFVYMLSNSKFRSEMKMLLERKPTLNN